MLKANVKQPDLYEALRAGSLAAKLLDDPLVVIRAQKEGLVVELTGPSAVAEVLVPGTVGEEGQVVVVRSGILRIVRNCSGKIDIRESKSAISFRSSMSRFFYCNYG